MDNIRVIVAAEDRPVTAAVAPLTPAAPAASLLALAEYVLEVERRFRHPCTGGDTHPLAPPAQAVGRAWVETWRLAAIELEFCDPVSQVHVSVVRDDDVDLALAWAPCWIERLTGQFSAGSFPGPPARIRGLFDAFLRQLQALPAIIA